MHFHYWFWTFASIVTQLPICRVIAPSCVLFRFQHDVMSCSLRFNSINNVVKSLMINTHTSSGDNQRLS